MKKQLRLIFDYSESKNGQKQTYDKPIEFPAKAPVAFHQLCQFGYHVFWLEKQVLKDRIEELETALLNLAHEVAKVSPNDKSLTLQESCHMPLKSLA